MARDQSALTNWTQYVAARALAGAIGAFPVEQNLHTAATVGDVFCRLSPRRRARAAGNIAQSFPHWPSEHVNHVVQQSMRHMFQLFMVDALMMPRLISAESWGRYVHLVNVGPALQRLVQRKPTIFLTGHCGNWELLGFALAAIGYPLAALARPLDNPLVNRWLLGIREARGLRVITKWGATPVLQELLSTDGQVGFIADQNAGDQGLFVPFFGRLASSYKSIALLAMRYDIPIVAAAAHRLGQTMRYEFRVADTIEPDDWADQPDPLYYITARYNRALESMIRRAPEQYIWVHRRWKSRPKHERLGKPMPPRMIAKLEQLPWMTQPELNRIIAQSNESARAAAT